MSDEPSDARSIGVLSCEPEVSVELVSDDEDEEGGCLVAASSSSCSPCSSWRREGEVVWRPGEGDRAVSFS